MNVQHRSRAGWRFALAGALCGAVAAGAAGAEFYVDDDAPPGGTGASWESAFNDLQQALTAAAGPELDVIRVAGGTYVPSLRNNPLDPRTARFTLSGGLVLLGGYAGMGANDPDERDPLLYPSTLSGDLAGDDGPGFSGNAENSYHVLVAIGNQALIVDGFTVRGGNAGEGSGGGLSGSGQFTVASCVFEWNVALDGGGASVGGAPTFTGCTFRNNTAGRDGGGMVLISASATLEGCSFESNAAGISGGGLLGLQCDSGFLSGCTFANNATEVGGGLFFQYCCSIELWQCKFDANQVSAGGGGAVIESCGDLKIVGCQFRDNDGGVGAGGLLAHSDALRCVDSVFAGNMAQFTGGGAILSATGTTWVENTAFVNNAAGMDGGVTFAGPAVAGMINCTVADNVGLGAGVSTGPAQATNCIFWGNSAGQTYGVQRTYSNVQGGAPGIGNINQDPLFVQPGTGDYRLSFGSPCIDAGTDAAVPMDACDIDGDGDVEEMLPLDLAGGPRLLGAHVDMGAYEGEHEPGFAAASASDIDQGEQVVLLPCGGPPDPTAVPVVFFGNTGGPDDASATVIKFDVNVHPGASGFNVLGATLRLETTLDDGSFLARIAFPLHAEDFENGSPLSADLTWFNGTAGRWWLAPLGNVQNSPGETGPLGQRILVIGPDQWGLTDEPGDFGAYWDRALQRGFVWANVDQTGDFAFGVNGCPADCGPAGGDDAVDVTDFVNVVVMWGQDNPVCDVDRSGTVNVADLMNVVGVWGMCP